MKQRRLFLRWALFAVLLAIGAVIVTRLGWTGQLLDADFTPITEMTFVVFVFATAHCGFLCWKHDAGRETQATIRAVESGWFASSICSTLGLLGTVIGLFLMLQKGVGVDADASAGLAQQILIGLKTALGTTITGGVTGLLLEFQCHSIKRYVEESTSEGSGT